MKSGLFILIFGLFIVFSEGSTTIKVPIAGNCGEDTVLNCIVTGSISSTGWFGLGRDLVNNGNPVRPEDNNKYTETRGTSTFTLTIHNTDISDEGTYRCNNGFDESQLTRLNIECKASKAVLKVTSEKKVLITVDKLYPASPLLTASFKKENSPVTVPGSSTCSSSTQHSGYYKCEWTSSNSQADGSYTYSLVVTTVTQAAPLIGSFTLVSPQTPVVSNAVSLENNREFVFGNEGQSLTIQCTSSGGYPAPTVAWYKDSLSSSNQLISTSSGTLQNDGTYTVTLQHTFTPTASDDLKSLVCRSYYPQADSAQRGSKSKSIILYLTLKPSPPTVTQTSVVSTGDIVEVSCRTTGCRPAANMSWSYQGSTTTGEVTSTLDAATETYTVVSLFRKQVTAADNGRTVQCIVTHPAFSPSERNASVNLKVHFSVGPSTTHITGNKEMIATGQTALTLTCTTGSSNPASDITWKNGSVTLISNRPYKESSGNNNGIVRSQQLVLFPTRYMEGDVMMCSVSNIESQSDVVDTITLNLKYRPLIEPMPEIITVEGNNSVLTCVASSKPVSTFKWYRGQSGILIQGTGTLGSNKLSYKINNVRRNDAATYRCNADNGIEKADNKNVLLTVYYPPDVIAVAVNTTVKATTALITCNARGMPNSNYKYGTWIQTWSGNNVLVSEKTENEILELKNLTYEHSGVYTCSASNGIRVFGTNKEFMEGSVQLVVKSFPIITYATVKTTAKLKENATIEVYYYSNVAGSEVKIYKTFHGYRRKAVIYSVSETPVEVNLPVFTQIIRTGGTRARILIQILSTDDLGPYYVVVANEIDSVTQSFEIVPRGPPSEPYNVTLESIQYNTAHLSWIRGYHGGIAQTFVIQFSTELNIWRNITVYGGINESLEPISEVLRDLHDSTTYFVRMYAFNNEGSSPFTEILNFTTPSQTGSADQVAITPSIVGGISAALVIIGTVVIVIVVRRKLMTKETHWSRKEKTVSSVEKDQEQSQPQTGIGLSNLDSMPDMYEQLHNTVEMENKNVYDRLKVDSDVTDDRTQYESLQQTVDQHSTYSTLTTETLNTNVDKTYENLKLKSAI